MLQEDPPIINVYMTFIFDKLSSQMIMLNINKKIKSTNFADNFIFSENLLSGPQIAQESDT
jgi:hypothetical protein